MNVKTGTASVLISLCLAASLFAGFLVVDGRAVSARVREDLGLGRGALLDRNGAPLAFTVREGRAAVRKYPIPSLAPILGVQDAGGRWNGLENRYDTLLTGRNARQDWRTAFLHLAGGSVHGGSVRLTIDSNVQRAADAALGRAQGAVVALQPQTGDVLAMVTKPYCRPKLLAAPGGNAQCRLLPGGAATNRAIHRVFAPGSIFKIVTLSAALDSGKFHLDDIFSGVDAFGPSPYFDNSLYPSNVTRADLTELTLEQALAFSDNFAFAHIGLTLGAPTLLRYAHRYGIDRPIPFIYPVARSSIASGRNKLSTPELAQSSFGAEVDRVTPLQMALIAATVANGGVMMAPHIIAGVRAEAAATEVPVHRRMLSRVISPASARDVTAAMTFVVDHGSGFNAQIRGMKVAGKTGTAASGADKPNAWFICFAPARHPVVAVAVLHQFSGEGFQYAAPIARKVLIAALRARGFHVR